MMKSMKYVTLCAKENPEISLLAVKSLICTTYKIARSLLKYILNQDHR